MSESASVRHKLLREFFQGWVIVDHHLAKPWKRGVRLVLRHFVGCVEQTKHCLAIIHSREKDHKLDINCDEVKIQRAELKVDGDVQGDLASINCGEQL